MTKLNMDETINATWYFGYRSNMNRGTFVDRRGMHPIRTRAGYIDNYRLCFNLAIGRGLRAVANLEARAGARTWGVLYLITAAEFDHLDRTEGVPLGGYRRIPVNVVVDTGETIAAFTYQSDKITEGRKPSARYIGLLIDGARQNGLPPDYLDFLQSFELAPDERLARAEQS